LVKKPGTKVPGFLFAQILFAQVSIDCAKSICPAFCQGRYLPKQVFIDPRYSASDQLPETIDDWR
jgi:hypothetical protein